MREHLLLRSIEKLSIRFARRLFKVEGFRGDQSDPPAGRSSRGVRRQFSGLMGGVAVLTAEGSSRNLRYKPVSPGCGTLSVASKNPVGTGTVWVNCGSDATESIKYRLLPVNWHGLSGLAEQRISLSTGRRTSTASGCQSPLPPSAPTARNSRGPNAQRPKVFYAS